MSTSKTIGILIYILMTLFGYGYAGWSAYNFELEGWMLGVSFGAVGHLSIKVEYNEGDGGTWKWERENETKT